MAWQSVHSRGHGEGIARRFEVRSRSKPNGDASNGGLLVPILLGGLSLAALYLLKQEAPQLKRYMKMRSM